MAVKSGRFSRIDHGVYVNGTTPIRKFERALGTLVATKGIASGSFAATLHDLDGAELTSPYVTVAPTQGSNRNDVRVKRIDESHIVLVNGYACTDGLQTLLDLASTLDYDKWEQALESALRKKLTTITAIHEALSQRRVGNSRIRRVLALRPHDAPPTDSILETMMVQLIRRDPTLPTPKRQVEVLSSSNTFVARIDLAWPSHGLFLELDGQHHKNQPVYDSRRETAIVATKGWLPGRFTWNEVTLIPIPTLRRISELFAQASRLHG